LFYIKFSLHSKLTLIPLKFNSGRGGFGGPPDHFGHQDSNQDTVFISGLPDDISEDQLVSHFGSIGVIKIDKKTGKPKIWIYRDKISGKGKGEATLTYDDPHTAKSAINWFNGKECGGKIIKVEFAQRKPGIGGDRGGGGGFGGGNPGRGFRGGGSRGSDRGGPRGASDGGGRQGDWRCPVQSCNNNNFSWRNECNRCKAPRPGDGGGAESFSTPQVVESSQRRGGGMAGRGRGGGGSRGMGGRGSRGGGPPRGPPGGRGGGGGRGGPMRSDFSDRRSKPY
jgi:RNA-binding protein FUS